MIQEEAVISLLLKASPSFKDKLEEHYKDWGEETSLYLVAGEFARHLVTSYEKGYTEEFPAVFELLEKLHLEGNEHVQEIATIGFLESLQNVTLNAGLTPVIFDPYLQPETKKWWNKLNDFWSEKRDEK